MNDIKIGLQLYSIRDEMANDVESALKSVSDIGYECVEFAGYFGKTAEEIKTLLNKYNLVSISDHQEIYSYAEEGQKAVDFQKVIGVKYEVIPGYNGGKLKNSDFWNETKDTFTKLSKFLAESNIELFYHNHEYEFKEFGGKYLHDYIFEELGLDVIKPEIDVCWVDYAGCNATDIIKKYKGNIPILHLKDYVCTKQVADEDKLNVSRADRGFEFRPLGQGVVNIKDIVKTAIECGTRYFIVEQDSSETISPLEAARESFKYLKSIGL